MFIRSNSKGSLSWISYALLLASGFFYAANAAAHTSKTGKAFVSIKVGKAVQVFPNNTTWKGGPAMLYDAVTPNGRMLLVTSPSTASVYVFDTSSGENTAVIKSGKAAKGVKISPDGKEAYVSNEGEATVTVINLKTLEVVEKITTEAMPHNVRFNANGKKAYVTLQGGAGLGVIDTKTRKVVRVIPIPGMTTPHNIDLSKDEKIAFVRDAVKQVAVVELATGTVKKLIEVGAGHGGIDVTPDDKHVVAGAIGDNYVTVIDTDTLKIIKKIKVGAGPHGVRATRDSRLVYVAVSAENKVVVIDTRTWEITKEYSVGDFPFWVAIKGNN